MIDLLLIMNLVGSLSAAGDVFRLVAFGDWGDDPFIPKIQQINRFISSQADPIDAALLLGDNFYPVGIIPGWCQDDEQFNLFSDHLAANLSIPFYVTLGNHDYLMGTESADCQLAYTHPLWRFPSRFHMIQHEFPGTTDTRAARLCIWVIDSVRYSRADIFQLRESIRNSTSTCRWKIFAAHYPPVTAGNYREDRTLELFRIRVVKPLHAEFRFDLIIAGHEHSSQIIHVWETLLLVAGAAVDTRSGSVKTEFALPERASLVWSNDDLTGVVLMLECTNETLKFKFVDVTSELGILVGGAYGSEIA